MTRIIALAFIAVTLYGASITPLAYREARRMAVEYAASRADVIEAVAKAEEVVKVADKRRELEVLAMAMPDITAKKGR